ncbi:hypothetical protein LFM09_21935 [Lentzea alba]|uniref:hypothetical protein n=1 Tax=Lentzea alba TaxID=2714351 RepID=UPI0039BF24D5
MAVIGVFNQSEHWLVIWLEPLGEDYWLRPKEQVRVRNDYEGDEPAFCVGYWTSESDRAEGIENVNVWVEHGNCDAEVIDSDGNPVDCGYQRPATISEQWRVQREQALRALSKAERSDV